MLDKVDNEITDCTRNGDLIMPYDHWIDGGMHNRESEYGFYSGFGIPFDFEEDVAGSTQGAIWDIGAYFTPR